MEYLDKIDNTIPLQQITNIEDSIIKLNEDELKELTKIINFGGEINTDDENTDDENTDDDE